MVSQFFHSFPLRSVKLWNQILRLVKIWTIFSLHSCYRRVLHGEMLSAAVQQTIDFNIWTKLPNRIQIKSKCCFRYVIGFYGFDYQLLIETSWTLSFSISRSLFSFQRNRNPQDIVNALHWDAKWWFSISKLKKYRMTSHSIDFRVLLPIWKYVWHLVHHDMRKELTIGILSLRVSLVDDLELCIANDQVKLLFPYIL